MDLGTQAACWLRPATAQHLFPTFTGKPVNVFHVVRVFVPVVILELELLLGAVPLTPALPLGQGSGALLSCLRLGSLLYHTVKSPSLGTSRACWLVAQTVSSGLLMLQSLSEMCPTRPCVGSHLLRFEQCFLWWVSFISFSLLTSVFQNLSYNLRDGQCCSEGRCSYVGREKCR